MSEDRQDDIAERLVLEIRDVFEGAPYPAATVLSALVYVLVTTAERAGVSQSKLIALVADACGARVEEVEAP